MKRFAILAVVAACSDTTNSPAGQLNLNRPIDVAFTCGGGLRITNGGTADVSQEVVVSAQPFESCDLRSAYPPPSTMMPPPPPPPPPGQEDLTQMHGVGLPPTFWYAFILQSVPGTVGIAKFPTQPGTSFVGGSTAISTGDVQMLDAYRLTPGKNGITVGEEPVGLATDKNGCFEVTANAGSCDLSALDVTAAIQAADPAFGISDASPRVDRITVTNAMGQPVRARPAAIVAEPPGGTIGVTCPQQPTGLVYVAYPSCHLVAAIDASNGKIVGGITYDAAGTPTRLTSGNVTCPDECGGTTPVTPGVRPVALDLKRDALSDRRALAIGADNSASLAIVELDPTSLLPSSISQVALQNTTGKLGVSQVVISPQIGLGGSNSVINDNSPNQAQFVYAVANDGTVRVADILTSRSECDTQVDPRFLTTEKSIKRLSCLPVGDAATPPRRPGARGPGIELFGHDVPTAIAIARVDKPPGDMRTPSLDPSVLIGFFGVITAASGNSYVLNVDDDTLPDTYNATDPFGTAMPLIISHQLRDALTDRSALAETCQLDAMGKCSSLPRLPICQTDNPTGDTNGSQGGPRASQAPQRVVPPGVIAAEKVASLPNFRQVQCTGFETGDPNAPTTIAVSETQFAAQPISVRDLEYPDLRGLNPAETWTLTFEGALSADTADVAIDGPAVRTSQVFVDGNGMRIDDQTRPFCDAGVEPNDVVVMRGCDPSLEGADCPLGYECFAHPDSQLTGLGQCMLTNEADRLSNACREYLISVRHYTVGKSTSGELVLVPRRRALQTTPIDGCASDAQCQSLAKYALQRASSANPIDDKTMDDPHAWACVADATRAPVAMPGGSGKLCEETCTVDTDCDAGTVCQGGFCMEGIVPPQACVNAPQRYELHAHDAMVMLGSRSGYVHPMIADTGGKCVADPSVGPWQVSRVPLWAPPCDPTADPRTGKLPNGTFEPNPCQLTVSHTEVEPVYPQGSCANPGTQLMTRQAQAIRLRRRGMTVQIVDPTYPGDAVCIGDRGLGLVNVPVVAPGAQLVFRQIAGLTPMILTAHPTLPVRALTGPQQSFWIIDEGDTLATSIGTVSTQGAVYRVESVDLSKINQLE